jgi:hypothetical protein
MRAARRGRWWEASHAVGGGMSTEREEATETHISWRVAAQSAVPVAEQPVSMCRSSSTGAEQHRQPGEVCCMP